MAFLLEWIYLGLNRNRFWFFSFKEIPLILDSQSKYWYVSYQTFLEIHWISKKDWQLQSHFSNFPFYWVNGPPRKVAKGINISRRFYESPRMIYSLFRGSPQVFFNNISVSLCMREPRILLSILLGDSTILWEGLVWKASILKMTAKIEGAS
jgi:hypothetical protein